MGNSLYRTHGPAGGRCGRRGKECSVTHERLWFVARLLDDHATKEVCREFRISRTTGYKIFEHYKEHRLEALSARPPAQCPPAAGPGSSP
jgi:transposase